jgi:hypothetical protein
MRWDDSAGRLTARGRAAEPEVELLPFYLQSRFGELVADTAGLTDLRVLQAPGGNAYVLARAAGGEWSLVLAPATAIE